MASLLPGPCSPQAGTDPRIFDSPVKLGRQPLSYTHVWYTLDRAATQAGVGHVSSHCFRHTYRTWLDSVGTPVCVQERLVRQSDIRTTMNIYGDAATEDMRKAQEKIVRLVRLSRLMDCEVDGGGCK